jgi:hypothetical protein
MADSVRQEDDSLVIDGDHSDVTADVVGTRPRKEVQVRVSPVPELVTAYFAEGEGTPEEAYYEGPLDGRRVRVEVLLDHSTIGSSQNFARFKSTGAPQPIDE